MMASYFLLRPLRRDNLRLCSIQRSESIRGLKQGLVENVEYICKPIRKGEYS